MFYYSYGSFLDIHTLQKHCPNATFVSKAVLLNFEVQFNFLSKKYNAGCTGVEYAPGKTVYGVIYEVSEEDMKYLDTIEGVPEGKYYRQTLIVVDEAGKFIPVEVYRTSHPSGPYRSCRLYVGKMLQGAKMHGLPDAYVEELQQLHDSLEQ